MFPFFIGFHTVSDAPEIVSTPPISNPFYYILITSFIPLIEAGKVGFSPFFRPLFFSSLSYSLRPLFCLLCVLCIFASLHLCAFAPLRLCGKPAIRSGVIFPKGIFCINLVFRKGAKMQSTQRRQKGTFLFYGKGTF